RPLSKLLEETGALAPARVAEIVRQIAMALAAAHELRIVHRDLKPDNVMIGTGRDGVDRVKVVDFGIAKVMADGVAKSTQTGQVIGTPDYMSPEQLAGARDLDGRSDIYSLALVTFAMLTGDLAFPGESPYERMMKRLTDRPRTLEEMRRDLRWPAPLQSAITRALARAPGDRYATAVDFARDVSRAIADWTSAGTEAPGWWSRFMRARPVYRWAPVPLLAAIGVVIYLAGASAPIPPPLKVDTTHPVRPRPDTAGSKRDTNRQDATNNGTVALRPKDSAWVRQQLASVRRLLAPGENTSTANAAKALRIAQDLLPYAKNVGDSVEAQYEEIEAYLVLTAVDKQAAVRACKVLQRIREPARNTQFARRVESLANSALASACPY
ncbi:MAG TPA: serine/threonine-protein kinase, partial [Gemmatimonadaceae bacterium]|nr:serine/threonine-protein kinase [Gemmatimonadaceae bacterium]